MMRHAIFIFKMFHQYNTRHHSFESYKNRISWMRLHVFLFITCKLKASKNLLEIRAGEGVSGFGNPGDRGGWAVGLAGQEILP